METIIAVAVVALAVVWAASRIMRANDVPPDRGCSEGCAGCQCGGTPPDPKDANRDADG